MPSHACQRSRPCMRSYACQRSQACMQSHVCQRSHACMNVIACMPMVPGMHACNPMHTKGACMHASSLRAGCLTSCGQPICTERLHVYAQDCVTARNATPYAYIPAHACVTVHAYVTVNAYRYLGCDLVTTLHPLTPLQAACNGFHTTARHELVSCQVPAVVRVHTCMQVHVCSDVAVCACARVQGAMVCAYMCVCALSTVSNDNTGEDMWMGGWRDC